VGVTEAGCRSYGEAWGKLGGEGRQGSSGWAAGEQRGSIREASRENKRLGAGY
jgi:hypothetical protein